MKVKKPKERVIEVVADWHFLRKQIVVGMLFIDTSLGREMVSFAYSDEYLALENQISIDPMLYLTDTGRQYPANGMFGVFTDSAPDRWGRRLMEQRHAKLVRDGQETRRHLNPTDYLLLVNDYSRMGGLRFREDGKYLDDSELSRIPPLTSLREMEERARRFDDNDQKLSDRDFISVYYDGSSIGGARPKVGVKDHDGSLWVAKFPRSSDEYDVGAWEMVVHDLAKSCEINVPEARLINLKGKHHTFLTKRFDRDGEKRIHFSSAMTLLGRTDGEHAQEGASYLEMAALLQRIKSKDPINDLQELWRRIVFSILVSNTDDHLRNHGFILEDKGWKLSPAYDINPNPNGSHLSLSIDGQNSDLDLDHCRKVAKFFHVESPETVISMMARQVSRWRDVAKHYGIGRGEMEIMARAFFAADSYTSSQVL